MTNWPNKEQENKQGRVAKKDKCQRVKKWEENLKKSRRN
jgi:hypothetical protein